MVAEAMAPQPASDYPPPDLKREKRVRFGKALGRRRRFDYIDDYGDNWVHRIRLLEVMHFGGHLDSRSCLDGANAFPPEDMGGEPGYMASRRAMPDPDHLDRRR